MIKQNISISIIIVILTYFIPIWLKLFFLNFLINSLFIFKFKGSGGGSYYEDQYFYNDRYDGEESIYGSGGGLIKL
jgi:hypothetical protein